MRDFTFVDDIAWGTVLAGTVPDLPPGTVLNLCGGTPTTMQDVVARVERITGSRVRVREVDTVAGDVVRTGGDHTLAARRLGWEPQVTLQQGLEQQVAERRERAAEPSRSIA